MIGNLFAAGQRRNFVGKVTIGRRVNLNRFVASMQLVQMSLQLSHSVCQLLTTFVCSACKYGSGRSNVQRCQLLVQALFPRTLNVVESCNQCHYFVYNRVDSSATRCYALQQQLFFVSAYMFHCLLITCKQMSVLNTHLSFRERNNFVCTGFPLLLQTGNLLKKRIRHVNVELLE
jgi:hypothetical protein